MYDSHPSIHVWLDTLAAQKAFDTANSRLERPQERQKTNRRKRQPEDESTIHPEPPRKILRRKSPRSTLAPLNPNTMSGSRQTRSSAKKTRGEEGHIHIPDESELETPRPSSSRAGKGNEVGMGDSVLDSRQRPVFALPRQERPASPGSPARSPARSNSATSVSDASSQRSRSPAKHAADLRYAEIPILYTSLKGLEWPADVLAVAQRVRNLAHVPHIPASVTERIEESRPWPVEAPNIKHGTTDTLRERLECERIIDIVDSALDCDDKEVTEAAWNCDVHSRILRLALRSVKGVTHFNVTAAKPHQAFASREQLTGDIMSSKLVDFTINLVPPTEALEEAIHRTIFEQSPSIRTTNQTMYSPVRAHPAAISIETKTSLKADQQKARVQLGMWTAAHYCRLRTLIPLSTSRKPEEIQMPLHPLIYVAGHSWKLMFGRYLNESERVQVLNPNLEIGLTDSVENAYQLVAGLRALAEWAEEEVWDWWQRVVLAV
ncbi:hypothetical protein MBLNU230_g4311t1 [Neophaeotheca triangularis]